MISRPILRKKITRNNIEYDLELWNTISDEPKYYPTNPNTKFNDLEPPSFKKDFFNDIAMNGTWPDVSKYQKKFDAWFDNLPRERQRQYTSHSKTTRVDEIPLQISYTKRWYSS